NGIHVSIDGGATFAAPTNPSTTLTFRGVRFAAADGRRVYATSYDGVAATTHFHRSDDGGMTFTMTPFAATLQTPPALLGADPRPPDTAYYIAKANGAGVLRRSADGGDTFDSISISVRTIYGGVFGADGTLYLATDIGVMRSPDGRLFSTPAAN